MPKQGGNTGTIAYSPGKLSQIKAAKARQEARWAGLCGPVTVSTLTPQEQATRTGLLTREQIRSVPCPACTAPPGESCRRPGNPASHRVRMNAARQVLSGAVPSAGS